MTRIIFICHGNICRSVAAEYIAKKYLFDIGKDKEFLIISRAVSLEEIGNDIYPPMKKELYKQNIPFSFHHATRITQEEYDKADYIFYMDESNLRYLKLLLKDTKKASIVTTYTPGLSYIEDPWYSDNFALVVNQLKQCIKDIFNILI